MPGKPFEIYEWCIKMFRRLTKQAIGVVVPRLRFETLNNALGLVFTPTYPEKQQPLALIGE
jgi:hypothetical protein